MNAPPALLPAALALVLLLGFASPALAQDATLSDEPVVMPTGEAPERAAANVDGASPSEPAIAPPIDASQPVAVRPRVRVTANQPGLALHRLVTPSALVASSDSAPARGELAELAPVCSTPCEIELDPGTYQLGVARGTGDAVFAGEPLRLDHPAELQLAYDDREAIRVAGWMVFGLGAAAGSGLMIASELSGESITDAPLLIAGLVTYAVGIAVGFPLVFLNDGASVDVRF